MSVANLKQEAGLVASLYEPHVVAARERFHESEAFARITAPDASSEFLDRFLIEFTARGVHMTEPVESWIQRAGKRTADVGFQKLGEALQRHAVHERDHHLLMINDTKNLVKMWNGRGGFPLDANELLEQPASPGAVAYSKLHESVIASETPYAQLGIEYEIEMLSLTVGVPFMKNILEICGADRIDGLTFIKDHVEIDVGHTEFNRRQLGQILSDRPDFAQPLAEAGTAALDAYGQFIADCLAAV